MTMLTVAHCLNSVKWVIPATFLLGTAPTFFILWGGWRFITLALPSRVYQVGDDFLYSMYQRCVLFVYEHVAGIQIFLSGDVKQLMAKKENVILIMNHQCAADWIIANILAVRQGSIGHIRYILKDELRYFPLYGFYFRQHSCIYVKRGGKFVQDKAVRQLEELSSTETPFWMVIFPEGTRYSPDFKDKLAKSQQFARDQGLPVLDEHLTPRTKAMYLCRNHLTHIDAIYDVTAAYSDTTDPQTHKRMPAPGLLEFMTGKYKQLHLHVERIPVNEVPNEEEKLKPWLHNRFVLKDGQLKRFYSQDRSVGGTLSSENRKSPLALSETLPSFLFWSAFNVPLSCTAVGRTFYWKAALFSMVSGWIWITIRF